MKKKHPSQEDLEIMRSFLRSKKITLKALSKEMNYSTPHISRVFHGHDPLHPKFMKIMLEAVQKILQKDLKQFYELIREEKWTTFT